MTLRNWLIIAGAWIASLVGVSAAVSVQSQARRYTPLPEPRVLVGADVGFRVEGMYGETPTGTIVIRVNGQWVEARIGGPSVAR